MESWHVLLLPGLTQQARTKLYIGELFGRAKSKREEKVRSLLSIFKYIIL